MIDKVHIKNFKSVVDLELELGSFNVLIGENGCGKSNILEALAFGAAASADKLDFEFLGSRGIRITKPEFMYSAFKKRQSPKPIIVYFEENKIDYFFEIKYDKSNSKKWLNINRYLSEKNGIKIYKSIIEKAIAKSDVNKETKNFLKKYLNEGELENRLTKMQPQLLNDIYYSDLVSEYIVYAPEQSILRKFEETNQIYPLGISGAGLFQYLKEIAFDKKNKETFDEIKNNLQLLDWYENFELPENLLSNEYSLKIKDKYLNEKLSYFDQRSTNEGFLFLLFYSTLFISKQTPALFAIDNIDASFNPKLCSQLIKNLTMLASKHKKQAIVTTHNPAVLDGLNLKDDKQRLFVISRNSEGHTRAERIHYNEKRTMKLSEVWTKGFIGGLPDNF